MRHRTCVALYCIFIACMTALAMLGGVTGLAQVPAVLPRIRVQNASATWSTPLTPTPALGQAASAVAPRITVEYASASWEVRLAPSTPLATAAAAVVPRIVVEYASAAIRYTLARPSFAVMPVREPVGTLRVAPGQELERTAGTAPRSVLLLVDSSGSMADEVDGVPKIEVARAVLLELVGAIPDEIEVGLLVFKDCAVIELTVPVGPLDRTRLAAAIRALRPMASTPIAGAIARVPGALAGHPEPYLVVLVTDGAETCGGDPVHAARDLIATGYRLTLHVIGYDVAGHADVQRQLREIAAAGRGSYFTADTAKELRTALRLATPVRYRVFLRGGGEVASGTVGDPTRGLRAGVYTVVIETVEGALTVDVTVQDGVLTTVWLDYIKGVFQARVE